MIACLLLALAVKVGLLTSPNLYRNSEKGGKATAGIHAASSLSILL
jgi:hypothetical protein